MPKKEERSWENNQGRLRAAAHAPREGRVRVRAALAWTHVQARVMRLRRRSRINETGEDGNGESAGIFIFSSEEGKKKNKLASDCARKQD